MWAVRKNPTDLTAGQKTTLAELEAVNAELFRAYLLKEQLREVFRRKGAEGHALLSGWILWARRCGIAEFEKLCRTIERYRALIGHTLDHNVTNARSEATNTHIRALTKRAYGYHSPKPSSAWPCSPAAGSAHPYQGETDPRKRQEIPPPPLALGLHRLVTSGRIGVPPEPERERCQGLKRLWQSPPRGTARWSLMRCSRQERCRQMAAQPS